MESNKKPLRKVIRFININFSEDSFTAVKMEVYECGHYSPPKHDIIGEYTSIRRRCHKCKNNKPSQLSEEELYNIRSGKHITKIEY